MDNETIEILGHKDFNHFNPVEESYDSLVDLIQACGFDNEYLDGRSFLLFNKPDGYKTSIWTPKGGFVNSQLKMGRLGVDLRSVAFKDFETIAQTAFFSREGNTVLTYPQAYEEVKKHCVLALVALNKYVSGVSYVTPKTRIN